MFESFVLDKFYIKSYNKRLCVQKVICKKNRNKKQVVICNKKKSYVNKLSVKQKFYVQILLNKILYELSYMS